MVGFGDALAEARAAWPGIVVDEDEFAAYLSARACPDENPHAPSAGLRAADLYIACACAGGDPRAIEAFEARFMPEVEAALKRLKFSPSAIDETKQVLRVHFFVDKKDVGPRIRSYSGRGDLAVWVRASAARAALRVVRTPLGQSEADEKTLAVLPSGTVDLELAYLRRTYGKEFEEALREGFAALAPQQRNLLRHTFRDAMTIDQIAALYRWPRSTAARRIASARDDLAAATRDVMKKRLNVASEQLASILRMIRSGTDVSLRSLLRTADGEPSVSAPS